MEAPAAGTRVRAGAPTVLLLLLVSSSAGAASGGLSLEGPAQVSALGPTLVTLDLTLRLRGVVCTGDVDVPVVLAVARASGADAALSWDRVVFRIAAHSAVESWAGKAEVALRVEPEAASGLVEVMARYDLPSACVALGGASSGETRHLLRVDAWTSPAAEGEPVPPKVTPASPPPSAPQTELPAPVIGAILGMCVGGLVVVVKRLRARPTSFEA